MKSPVYNRTKIICTIGPASASEEVLTRLIEEGMDVARLNFSHGEHATHKKVIALLKKIRRETAAQVAILQDLQGPKIRIGILEKPFPINQGDELFLNSSIQQREDNVLPIQYTTFARDVKEGDLVLIDDGKVTLTVLETNHEDLVRLRVVYGTQIGSRKGVNLPFTDISLPSITDKDMKDLYFGIEQGVDWVALSFVRTAYEVKEIKRIIRSRGGNQLVIAKIEKPEALANIDEIISAADAIMIARGDLGVEIPMEEVPGWQKKIIQKCNVAAKPVIVATQMMESMISNSRPTRAETADVANAVMDGADALMLSGETSVGEYPVEVVQSMQRIIASMEKQDQIYYKNLESDPGSPTWLNDAIIVMGCKLAQETDASAILGLTVSGYTAYQLSKCRPKAHIYIFTPNRRNLSTLALLWGVRTFYYDGNASTDQTVKELQEILENGGFIKKGDIMINTASMPLEEKGRTNMVKVTEVK